MSRVTPFKFMSVPANYVPLPKSWFEGMIISKFEWDYIMQSDLDGQKKGRESLHVMLSKHPKLARQFLLTMQKNLREYYKKNRFEGMDLRLVRNVGEDAREGRNVIRLK